MSVDVWLIAQEIAMSFRLEGTCVEVVSIGQSERSLTAPREVDPKGHLGERSVVREFGESARYVRRLSTRTHCSPRRPSTGDESVTGRFEDAVERVGPWILGPGSYAETVGRAF